MVSRIYKDKFRIEISYESFFFLNSEHYMKNPQDNLSLDNVISFQRRLTFAFGKHLAKGTSNWFLIKLNECNQGFETGLQPLWKPVYSQLTATAKVYPFRVPTKSLGNYPKSFITGMPCTLIFELSNHRVCEELHSNSWFLNHCTGN